MDQTWTTALKGSISDTFSTMFFVVPEPDSEWEARLPTLPPEPWLEGTVDLSLQGKEMRVWVWAPENLARELAANILTCEPEQLSQDDLLDSYREMLNMVAGSLLTQVDTDSSGNMGLPQAQLLPQGEPVSFSSQAQSLLVFDAEGKPLLAGWAVI